MIYPFAPTKSLAYVVPESVESVRRKLLSAVEISYYGPRRGSQNLFWGTIEKNEFKLSLIDFRMSSFVPKNSFCPIAIGRIESAPNGTTIHILFSPSTTTQIFGFWWHVFIGPPLVLSVLLSGISNTWPGILFFGGMLIIFWILQIAGTRRGIRDYIHAFDQVVNNENTSTN